MHLWLVYIFGLICWTCTAVGGFETRWMQQFLRRVIMPGRAPLPGKIKRTAWLIHVIHSQSMERLASMEYSTNPTLARFIRLLYPQKIIVRHSIPRLSRSDPWTWVMLLAILAADVLHFCKNWTHLFFYFPRSRDSDDRRLKSVDPADLPPFPQLGSCVRSSSSAVSSACSQRQNQFIHLQYYVNFHSVLMSFSDALFAVRVFPLQLGI